MYRFIFFVGFGLVAYLLGYYESKRKSSLEIKILAEKVEKFHDRIEKELKEMINNGVDFREKSGTIVMESKELLENIKKRIHQVDKNSKDIKKLYNRHFVNWKTLAKSIKKDTGRDIMQNAIDIKKLYSEVNTNILRKEGNNHD